VLRLSQDRACSYKGLYSSGLGINTFTPVYRLFVDNPKRKNQKGKITLAVSPHSSFCFFFPLSLLEKAASIFK
jgi:hypothetical protein